MKNKNLISINDFTKEEHLHVLDVAEGFEKQTHQPILTDKVVATLFFEPSTRTRLSFESAANQLGARVIGFSDSSNSSVSKGETLKDTILMVSNYADLIVMRHPKEGSARYASEVAKVPVINAGDGANQHPTQCLLDMYSIRKTQGHLDHLNIAFVGDLKYGRTVHSLTNALCNFGCTFHLVSPPELKLPSYVKQDIKDRDLEYHQYTNLNDVIPIADIIYMTRVQRERFADPMEYEKVKNTYILNQSMLQG
ncbi:MAG: aspartate carbamoyltransferase, partial [Bacteroidales bacterium]